MHAVILGAGVVGFQVARQLIAEGKDIAIIENNPERARYASHHLDCLVINEEGSSISSLKRAGIEKADFFISVTNSDEVNMITCGLVASEFDVKVKIARVRNLEYSKARIFEKSFLGIDYIVNPEVETSKLLANMVALGANSDVMLFHDTDAQMRNVIVSEKSFFRNRSLKEIKKIVKEPFLVSGVLRDDTFIIPSGDTVIKENDNIYLLAEKKIMTKIFIQAGRKSEKIEKIAIVGGGKIASLATQYLIRTGRKITIIEENYDKCHKLSEKFPEALIIRADISEEEIFEEEQIHKYDLLITTTDNHELNILSSIYAKTLGIKRTIALVEKSSYIAIASRLGIDSIVNPKISTVDAVLKNVRRGNIKSIHSLFDGKAEVIEYLADNRCKLIDRPLKDNELPEGALILLVNRNKKNIIPDGNFVVKEGDFIIVIAGKKAIPAIENLFQG